MNAKSSSTAKGWKKFLKIAVLLGVLAVVLLSVFVVVAERWTKWQWETYRAELAARGVPLTFPDLAPPPVPDSENFAKCPLFDGILDVDGEVTNPFLKKLASFSDVFEHKPFFGSYKHSKRADFKDERTICGGRTLAEKLEEFSDELREIEAQAQKPYARFDLPCYSRAMAIQCGRLAHVNRLRDIGRLFFLRGVLSLNRGAVSEAYTDVTTIFRIAKSLDNEPLIISQSVAFLIRWSARQLIWEGTVQRKWTDEQLARFQAEFSQPNALSALVVSFREQRVFLIANSQLITSARTRLEDFLPVISYVRGTSRVVVRTWLYTSLVYINKWLNDWISAVDPSNGRVRFDLIAIPPRKGPVWLNLDRYYADLGLASVDGIPALFAEHQAKYDEAVVACALERYYLKNQAYPETLDALVPEFLSKIPHEAVSGEPIRYTRTAQGRFTLDAPVWEKDEKTGAIQKSLAKEAVWKFE